MNLREVQKWREVEEAQVELEGVKEMLQERLEEIAGRWRKVEEGQRLLKQNLVKYNSFIKEKKSKVAEEISRRMMEKNRQMERNRVIKRSTH